MFFMWDNDAIDNSLLIFLLSQRESINHPRTNPSTATP